MRTFEEVAKAAVIRAIEVFDDRGYCTNQLGQKTCREEHESGCPFHGVDIEDLLAWASGAEMGPPPIRVGILSGAPEDY